LRRFFNSALASRYGFVPLLKNYLVVQTINPWQAKSAS